VVKAQDNSMLCVFKFILLTDIRSTLCMDYIVIIPSLGQGPLSWHFFSIQCSLDTLISFTVLTDHPSAKVFDENA